MCLSGPVEPSGDGTGPAGSLRPVTDAPAGERKRTRLPRAQRREQLLDVAAGLVVERGVDAVTMEGVAEHAGVSKGLGYAYFDNADDLLAALFDREIGALDERAGAAVAGAQSIEEALRATLEVWLDAIRDRGTLLGALLQAQAGTRVEDRRRRRQAIVHDFWADAAVSELGISPAAARTAAVVLLTGATGLIDLWIRGKVRRRDLVDAYITLAVGGLQALSGARGRAQPPGAGATDQGAAI